MTTLSQARHQVAIAGKVTYARTGRPIGGATVEAAGPSVTRTRSAPDGLFYFLDLPDGLYTVQASVPGAVNRFAIGKGEAKVSRKAGRIQMATVELAVDGTTVKGRITVKGKKTGIAMAEVRIKGSGESAFSDAQGQYILAGIEPGKRTLLVYAQGYKEESREVTLEKAGSLEPADFALRPEAG